jgi:hypothetical protein
MNKLFKIATVIAVLIFTKLPAQNIPGIEQTDHSTIDGIKVKYKAVSQGTAVPQGSLTPVQGIPEGVITLKEGSNVSKIYLTVYGSNTVTPVYQVNYQLSSGPVFNGEKKLFENSNGVIFISSGQAMALRPYTYKLKTEDSQGNQSSVFSTIQ